MLQHTRLSCVRILAEKHFDLFCFTGWICCLDVLGRTRLLVFFQNFHVNYHAVVQKRLVHVDIKSKQLCQILNLCSVVL